MTPVAATFPKPGQDPATADLAERRLENRFVAELPAGPVYTIVKPTPVAAPKLLAWSDELAAELGLSRPSPRSVEILGGNRITPSMQPYSARYGGHQFGNWAGQLGDGRAITLGEIAAQELQLKG